MIEIFQKFCAKCERWIDKKKFSRNMSISDGLQTYCKDCCRELLRQFHLKNPEKGRSYMKKWREENPVRWREIQEKSKTRRAVSADG